MTENKQPKQWKNFNEQLEILQQRGLIIDDKEKALKYLRTIGYYRLSGYLYPFRQVDPNNPKQKLDTFIDNSHFEDVKNLYVFDKKLRQLALDALERIEIALRVDISYLLGEHSPTAYRQRKYFDENFLKDKNTNHQNWLKRLDDQLERAKSNAFVKHHLDNYSDFPIWVACEVWDFGTLSILYGGMKEKDKNRIAQFYQVKTGKQLQSYLHSFNILRNICAHHSRLWNLTIKFKASTKNLSGVEWKKLSNKQLFFYFCLMKQMLDIICPNSTWGKRFLDTLDEFPQVKNNTISLEKDMGMIIDPKQWSLWYR